MIGANIYRSNYLIISLPKEKRDKCFRHSHKSKTETKSHKENVIKRRFNYFMYFNISFFEKRYAFRTPTTELSAVNTTLLARLIIFSAC